MTEAEAREHLGQPVCEDCYMTILSPVRTCYPWAVYSAKSFEQHTGQPAPLTPLQHRIINILQEHGSLAPPVLLPLLGGEVTMEQLAREFAAWRHLEKVRGEKTSQGIVWRLW